MNIILQRKSNQQMMDMILEAFKVVILIFGKFANLSFTFSCLYLW